MFFIGWKARCWRNPESAELFVGVVLPQCGFSSGRRTVDMVFCLRKACEHAKELFVIFVDLVKM